MMDGKKVHDIKARKIFKTAMLCKLMNCRPSELRNEDYEELELVAYTFEKLMEKHPLTMFF